jgi:hypothetical protein
MVLRGEQESGRLIRPGGGARPQTPVMNERKPAGASRGDMKARLPKLTSRQIPSSCDLVVTRLRSWRVSICAETPGLVERLDGLLIVLPGFLIYAAGVFQLFELHRGNWRFASLPDLFNIFRAVSVLAVSLLVLDYILVAPNFLGTFFFGKLTIVLYWFLQMFFLGGPRIAYRYFRYSRTRHHAMVAQSIPTLVLGRAADADVLVRAIESGAVKKIWPVGILSPSYADQGQSMRGVPVVGTLDDLEEAVADFKRGQVVARIAHAGTGTRPGPEAILMRAAARPPPAGCPRSTRAARLRLPSMSGPAARRGDDYLRRSSSCAAVDHRRRRRSIGVKPRIARTWRRAGAGDREFEWRCTPS